MNADLKRKISYLAYLPCGITLVVLSSFFVYMMLYGGFGQLGFSDIIVLSFLFFLLYGVGFFMLYTFSRYGYPTSYLLDDEGVKVLFHRRQLVFIPYHIIERVTLDEEGPSLGRIMIGLSNIRDMTARKRNQYVAVETPVFTCYLSPSNPEEFKSEVDRYVKNTTASSKEDLMEVQSQVKSSRMLSLRRLLLVLFVKTPIGQLYVSFLIIWIITSFGYPQLVYLSCTVFLIGLHFVIYIFLSSIASQLLGSNASSSGKVESVTASIAKKTGRPVPKIEVADPLVKGLNAFAAGSSPSKSVVILTKAVEKLSPDEIEAIVLHELCHINHWHSLGLTMINVIYLVLIYFLSLFKFDVINLMCLVFLSLLATSLVSKTLEREADIFAAGIVGPAIFSSALLKVGEDAALRMYVLTVTLAKPRPLEEIKEAMGVTRPKKMLRRLFLWIFSLHPPIYYRINTVNNYNYQKTV